MSRKKVSVWVDEELYIQLATLALKKYKGSKGSISRALYEAIVMWVETNRDVE